ncbi:hypothetical protein Pmar_PMAR025474, partial [Perkinsus marinus ATCC 50983]
MATGLVKCEEQIAKCNENGPGKSPVAEFCEQAVATCEKVVLVPVVEANISV